MVIEDGAQDAGWKDMEEEEEEEEGRGDQDLTH